MFVLLPIISVETKTRHDVINFVEQYSSVNYCIKVTIADKMVFTYRSFGP